MLLINFVSYARQQRLQSRELVSLVLGIAVLILVGFAIRQTLQQIRKQHVLKWGDVVSPLFGLAMAAGLLLSSYSGLHDRYLLRDEVARFTAGSVYKHATQRGEPQLVYEYYIAGQRYQDEQACGELRDPPFPCLPVGTRCFVRFSPERPTLARLLATPVPDTLRHVPAAGWARLP